MIRHAGGEGEQRGRWEVRRGKRQRGGEDKGRKSERKGDRGGQGRGTCKRKRKKQIRLAKEWGRVMRRE